MAAGYSQVECVYTHIYFKYIYIERERYLKTNIQSFCAEVCMIL